MPRIRTILLALCTSIYAGALLLPWARPCICACMRPACGLLDGEASIGMTACSGSWFWAAQCLYCMVAWMALPLVGPAAASVYSQLSPGFCKLSKAGRQEEEAMCAGVGTQLFPSVKWGMNLTRQVNFTSFTRSFLLLLQTMTGMLLSPS